MTDAPKTVLETERLILRHYQLPGDVDSLFPIYQNPDMRRFFPEGILTYDETREEIEGNLRYYAKYGFGLWPTIYKETGEFIGRCGLLPWHIDGRDEIEVAYSINQPFWGQGLGTEAARAIARYAFEELQMTRLICLVDPENYASQKVAQNIGMTLELDDIIDGDRTFLYSMNRPDTLG